ncbi:hypothetical protein N7G274_009955 [Stereocaulon virgatum]|uniref:Uncharacterized protein n=1 Tax=Stereocaulon virgatum TaxID=373712 RepID=A0ABR3ZX50_9LECA
MQAVQFPEFHGVFGEMPLFEDQGRWRANNNVTRKWSSEISQGGSQGPNKVQPAEEVYGSKAIYNQLRQPRHTVNISDTGANVQIPVRRSIRTPRQDRHIKEVAFVYEMEIGLMRIKCWEHYLWLRHEDGWGFLEFLAGVQGHLDQHLHELCPLWTVNVETRIAMLTLDRKDWRECSLGNTREDDSYSAMEESVRDPVEIIREETTNTRTLVLRILQLLVQGIEDPDYLDVHHLVCGAVAG